MAIRALLAFATVLVAVLLDGRPCAAQGSPSSPPEFVFTTRHEFSESVFWPPPLQLVVRESSAPTPNWTASVGGAATTFANGNGSSSVSCSQSTLQIDHALNYSFTWSGDGLSQHSMQYSTAVDVYARVPHGTEVSFIAEGGLSTSSPITGSMGGPGGGFWGFWGFSGQSSASPFASGVGGKKLIRSVATRGFGGGSVLYQGLEYVLVGRFSCQTSVGGTAQCIWGCPGPTVNGTLSAVTSLKVTLACDSSSGSTDSSQGSFSGPTPYQPYRDKVYVDSGRPPVSSGNGPVLMFLPRGEVGTLNLGVPAIGRPAFLFLGARTPLQRSRGAIETPGGQLLNLDLGDPALAILDVTSLFSASHAAQLTLPPGLNEATFQLVSFDASAPDGIMLSAPAVLKPESLVAQSFAGVFSGPADFSNILLSAFYAPAPNVDDRTEVEIESSDSVIAVGDFTSGRMQAWHAGLAVADVSVMLDNRTLQLTRAVDGMPLNSLSDVFHGQSLPAGMIRVTAKFDHTIGLDSYSILDNPSDRAAQIIPTPSRCRTAMGEGVPFFGKPLMNTVQVLALNAWYDIMTPGRRVESADSRYQCHSFTFIPMRRLAAILQEGIQVNIASGEDVQRILNDNGFVRRPSLSVAEPLDVVIYRNGCGEIIHSGRVVEVGADGAPLVVVSKWGTHPVMRHGIMDPDLPRGYIAPGRSLSHPYKPCQGPATQEIWAAPSCHAGFGFLDCP